MSDAIDDLDGPALAVKMGWDERALLGLHKRFLDEHRDKEGTFEDWLRRLARDDEQSDREPATPVMTAAARKPAEPKTVYSFKAEIVRWVDGDSVVMSIDRAFSDVSVRTLRVKGINAPDKVKGDPNSKKRTDAATRYAESLAPAGSSVQLQSVKGEETEKYGRYLAVITLPDGRDFAAEMIKADHAKAYDGTGPRD